VRRVPVPGDGRDVVHAATLPSPRESVAAPDRPDAQRHRADDEEDSQELEAG
jgi:hypothetical protein